MIDLDRHDPPSRTPAAMDAGTPMLEPLEASEGALAGTIGDVTPAGSAEVRSADETVRGLTVELHVDGPESRVMHLLQLETSFAELTPGEYTSATMAMSVLGCSGPPDTDWLYDERTGDIDLRVSEPVSGTLQLDWTARFPETPYYGDPSRTAPAQQSSGTVRLRR